MGEVSSLSHLTLGNVRFTCRVRCWQIFLHGRGERALGVGYLSICDIMTRVKSHVLGVQKATKFAKNDSLGLQNTLR